MQKGPHSNEESQRRTSIDCDVDWAGAPATRTGFFSTYCDGGLAAGQKSWCSVSL
jgi:hypothetical protein